MLEALVFVVCLIPGIMLALPAIVDLAAWGRARFRPIASERPAKPGTERFLFLVPAHDEEALIDRCVRSLREQSYPPLLLTVAVVADNCGDRTAEVARRAGALALERWDEKRRGKHRAIAWALEQLPIRDYDAVAIIDADTIVASDFAEAIARWAPLRTKVLQAYNGMSNEFENWVTRMAGVLTRNRYEIALPLKTAAGLNVPLAGDGTVIGTDVLQRCPWRIQTITEGWELYATYTLRGIPTRYEPKARFYAQEARSLSQGRSQRERWTAGRLAVLRREARAVLTTPGVDWLQRLDLLAELSSLGPMMRAFLGLTGVAATVLVAPPAAAWLACLFASTVVQPALYSVISLARHPDRWRALRAFLGLPVYAGWRVAVGLRALALSGTGMWVRTGRHKERVTAKRGA